ncbi:MAG: hypothetical protein AB2693_28215 [Candidatus Thiodiazotropha sp.]
MGPQGQAPYRYGISQQSAYMGATSPQYQQPYKDIRTDQSLAPVISQSNWIQASSVQQTGQYSYPTQSHPYPSGSSAAPSGGAPPTMLQTTNPPSLANVKIEYPEFAPLCRPEFALNTKLNLLLSTKLNLLPSTKLKLLPNPKLNLLPLPEMNLHPRSISLSNNNLRRIGFPNHCILTQAKPRGRLSI